MDIKALAKVSLIDSIPLLFSYPPTKDSYMKKNTINEKNKTHAIKEKGCIENKDNWKYINIFFFFRFQLNINNFLFPFSISANCHCTCLLILI